MIGVDQPRSPTAPETYTYDSRGNVISTRNVSKTPGTPTDIVTPATYPASCASPLTCNKPTATIDANGNQTDYTYDSGTGFMTSVTGPAPSTGAVRPQTRYGYTALNAYYKNSSGSIVAAGLPITKLTSVSSCATLASCAGGSDEAKTTIGYGLQMTGTANNLLPVTVTQGSGDGTSTLPSTVNTVYDNFGNIFTVQGPLGAAYTTRYRYDLDREIVGVVGPDPDGAGTLKNRATKFTYNADGQVTLTEQGTVTDQSDPAWANFATLQQLTSTYDGNARKTRDKATAGAPTYAVTDYSYDADGRPDCTAVRMNSTAWDTTTAACTLQTTGSDGPDRITKTLYDAAGAVYKVQTAFGVTTANGFPATLQRDEVTNSFTPNGRQASMADAKGNLTSYAYDGFDRLSRTCFLTAIAACPTSTGDYEQRTYDANSNVTVGRLRDGNTIINTYDALNRLIYVTMPHLNASDTDKSYGYDNLGRLTAASDSGGNYLAFGYDALGRRTSEASQFSGTKTMSYDLAGRRTSLQWSSDLFYVAYEYLATGEMTAIRENGAASGVGLLAIFNYDDLGRRISLVRGNGLITYYAYDGASRLTGLADTQPSQPYHYGFGYNAASQIATRTSSNDAYAFRQSYNANRGYTANGLNQYTAAGTTAPGYDARGNLTSLAGAGYGYTARNELATYPGGGAYSYDALGRLTLASTSGVRLDYDGSEMVTELDTSNAILRRYVFGPGADEPLVWYEGSGTSDRRFLSADERGSIVQVTDSGGNLIGINAYDEYGVPQTGNVGRFQYTGQAWLPEIGMYDYKARIYAPKLGRFLQTDPVGYASGINWYNYVGSDPVNATDPSGKQFFTVNTAGDTRDILYQGPNLAGARSYGNPFINLSHAVDGFVDPTGIETPPTYTVVNQFLRTTVSDPNSANILPQSGDFSLAMGHGSAASAMSRYLDSGEVSMYSRLGYPSGILTGTKLYLGVPEPFTSYADGFSLPGKIYLDNLSSALSSPAQAGLIGHELFHQWQYSTGTTVGDFIGNAIRYGTGPETRNPLEMPAYAIGHLITQCRSAGSC